MTAVRTHRDRAVRVALMVAAAAHVSLGGCSTTIHPSATSDDTVSTAVFAQPSTAAKNAGTPRTIDSGGVIRQVQPWTFAGADGQLVTTDRFRIYITERDALVASRMPGFMEAALDNYTHALGPLPQPKERLETFIMGSRGQWREIVLHMLGARGQAFVTSIQRGGVTYAGRSYLFGIGSADTMNLASHEGWHMYTQSTFQEPIPLWLEEGIASFMEGHRWTGATVAFAPWANLERFDQLRRAAAANTLLRLPDLLSTPPQDLVTQGVGDTALTYYAQVWALVHFLREGAGGKYRAGFEQLLADAAAGQMSQAISIKLREKGLPEARSLSRRLGSQVFQAYFNSDMATAEVEYRSFLNKVVEPGSRQAVVAGTSPLVKPAAE